MKPAYPPHMAFGFPDPWKPPEPSDEEWNRLTRAADALNRECARLGERPHRIDQDIADAMNALSLDQLRSLTRDPFTLRGIPCPDCFEPEPREP